MDIASREIMWNVGGLWNVVVMYGLFALAAVIGLAGTLRHSEIVLSGQQDTSRNFSVWNGFMDMFSWAALQKGVLKERTPGIAHTMIYIGFLALTFTTTMVMIDHDFGIEIYQGNFYLVVTLLSDLLGFALLIGLALMAHRRYIAEEDKLHNTPADVLFLSSLAALVVQGFVLEGLRIHVTADPWALWSPVGLLTAKAFWFLSAEAASALHFVVWWIHAITVFAFVAVAPYTKLFHVLASSLNLFFKSTGRPKGTLPSPGDIEKLMETEDDFRLGLGTIKDYTWKQLLDLEACTSCGRCQDVCPAYVAEKPLSPKWLILDTRNHALALHAKDALEVPTTLTPAPFKRIDTWFQNSFFLPSQGLNHDAENDTFSGQAAFRGKNEAVQRSVLSIGGSAEDRIAGTVMSQDVFWSCTTCMACVEACPVGIDHVEQIVENRRNMVLMEGEIPSEAQNMLRALENRGNPYGAPEDRINWLEDLNVKILQPGDSVDYLYWVGCVSAYDPRKQKIAQSLVKIMQRAGLSFGILGTAEGCTGDPARRVGEENLFQSLAKQNLEVLRSVQFKYLVANCPHCFNSIKNDYPSFGNLADGAQPEIIHHSRLLERLVAEGKISLTEGAEEQITFHDPCYLGRYNEEYEAPRKALNSVKSLQIVEMEPNREKGMCCGAGGGHFWMDNKEGKRINVIRTEQAAATNAKKIATACPFCMQMMEDGVKLSDREESHQVKDIAEVLYENLADN